VRIMCHEGAIRTGLRSKSKSLPSIAAPLARKDTGRGCGGWLAGWLAVAAVRIHGGPRTVRGLPA
jgi:hypothetical protein